MSIDGSRNIDTIFPYPTPKVARIKDARLGLLRYTLLSTISAYILIYQIMFKGAHLQSLPLAGVNQVEFNLPTMDNCDSMHMDCMQNFTSMSQLAYCSQNKVSSATSAMKLPCQYWDATRLSRITDHGLMIPTHIKSYLQTRGCKPAAENNWTCVGWLYDYVDKQGRPQTKRGDPKPTTEFFVADVERYTMLMDHSVRSSLGHRFYSSDMSGDLLDCSDEDADDHCEQRPIKRPQKIAGHSSQTTTQSPVHTSTDAKDATMLQQSFVEQVQENRGDDDDDEDNGEAVDDDEGGDGDEDVGNDDDDTGTDDGCGDNDEECDGDDFDNVAALQVQRRVTKAYTQDDPAQALGRTAATDLAKESISLAQGDLFSIGLLLKSANVSLDKSRHHLPTWIGGSYRSSGLVLVVRVAYSNTEHWLGLKVLPWKILGPKPRYTVRITKHSSFDDFLLRKTHHGGPKDPKGSRILTEFYGIRILIEQSGFLVVWNNIQLLLLLTTTLALMTIASCITDCVALYCLSKSDEYWAIKFERPRRNRSQKQHDSPHESEDNDIQRQLSLTM